MADLVALASRLLAMHHTGTTLVLPTVWDAWSAKTMVDAGFEALTIGSHPLANARGRLDSEGMTFDDALDGARRVIEAVDVPVSLDVESGYGRPAGELVERVLEVGAVGINVEDTVHSEGHRLRSVDEHAEYIGALREAADAAGVELVINARTDVFLKPAGTFADPLGETITRLSACRDAGARCLYPLRAPDADAIRTLRTELGAPINVIAHPLKGSTAGSLDDLRALGVHRVSFGPYLQGAVTGPMQQVTEAWR